MSPVVRDALVGEGLPKAARGVPEQQGRPDRQEKEKGAAVCQKRRPWLQDS